MTPGTHSNADADHQGLWHRTKAVAGQALELPALERHAFVEAACAHDPELLSEVRALLKASLDAGEALTDAGLPASALADVLETPVVAPGTMIGRYRVARPIGAGGMGAVFEANDTSLNRKVALKLLTLGLASTGARKRFEGEAMALARLDHPCLARIYEAGVHTAAGLSVPYFAMAFVEDSRTLDTFFRDTRPDARTAMALFARICDAVHHGHQKGVLHRDLKPSNILIDREGCPQIVDFGVSRLLDTGGTTQSTRAGEIVGTPAYLPPEAFEQGAQSLDTRADVYALGVVLYEVLCGSNPFTGPTLTPVQIGKRVCSKPPPLLGSLREDCMGDVETIIAKAMARDPRDRYPSVEQLGADLRRVLSYEPILARPAPVLRQARLFARRNRVLVAACGAVALALVLGIAGLGVGFARARASERRAREEADRATKVSAFIMRMFRSASPFHGAQFRNRGPQAPRLFDESEAWPNAAIPGRAPTVGDLLFAASGHLEESFPNDPALQADMASALARTASDISDYRIGVFTSRAASLLSTAYGRDDPRTLAARQGTYSSELVNGSAVNIADMERDLNIIRHLPISENELLLQWAWSHYTQGLRMQNRGKEALDVLRSLRADIGQSMPGDSPTKIALDLAIIRLQTPEGDSRAALDAMPALLARARALPDTDSQWAVLSVLFDTQFHQSNMREFDAAMHTLSQGASLSSQLYGGMDQGTYEWWNNLYFVALMTQNFDIAEYAAREQLRGADAMLGPHSFYTTKAQGRLARSLLSQHKNLEEAERAARRAIDGAPEMLPIGEGWALYHELLWAWCIRLQGDPQRADRIIRDRMGNEVRAGRPVAVNWVELLRATELAQCEMDMGERAGDLPSRLPAIDALLSDAECWAEELGRDWPSVHLTEEARQRYDMLTGRTQPTPSHSP